MLLPRPGRPPPRARRSRAGASGHPWVRGRAGTWGRQCRRLPFSPWPAVGTRRATYSAATAPAVHPARAAGLSLPCWTQRPGPGHRQCDFTGERCVQHGAKAGSPPRPTPGPRDRWASGEATWAPSRCRPEGFPRVTAISAFTAPAPFGVGARGSPNPRSVSHPERLKRGPRATGPSLCKHFLGPTLSRGCARPAP